MARKSMGHLTRATVAAETGPRVSLGELLSRIRKEGDAVADRFAFRAEGEERGEIPADVADAIVLAVVQAMMNSVKHAGGPEVPRSVVVRGAADGSVQAEVTDGGRGFDPGTINSERLGVRVSILERIRLVEGEAELQSAPGVGTTVRLRWPATAPEPAAEAEEAMASG
jgi:signal transduction histidine kinase